MRLGYNVPVSGLTTNIQDHENSFMAFIGWTGDNCLTDINECISQPCINGGLCIEKEPGAGYE